MRNRLRDSSRERRRGRDGHGRFRYRQLKSEIKRSIAMASKTGRRACIVTADRIYGRRGAGLSKDDVEDPTRACSEQDDDGNEQKALHAVHGYITR